MQKALAAGDGFQCGQTAKAREGHRVQSLPEGRGRQPVSAVREVIGQTAPD